MSGPCLSCADRKFWCHGSCKDYMAFQAKNEMLKKARYAELNKNGISIDSYSRQSNRNRNPSRTLKTTMR